jgi:hypothetical protein
MAEVYNWRYEARIVRRSDHSVIWTSAYFSGTSIVDVEYYGNAGVVYDLEIRTTAHPNSEWRAVGEFINQYCPNTGGGTTEKMMIYPNPNNGIFTLKRLETEQTSSGSVQGNSLQENPEQLILRIYSTETAILMKQITVTLSNECNVDTGGLPKGNYIVQIIRNGEVIQSIKIKID